MSRLEEVENCIRWAESIELDMARIARTLATEVDELRAKLDQVRSEIGCARGQRTTQFCADLERTMKERDELQRRLDAVVKSLEPETDCECVGCVIQRRLHARTIPIAEGRGDD